MVCDLHYKTSFSQPTISYLHTQKLRRCGAADLGVQRALQRVASRWPLRLQLSCAISSSSRRPSCHTSRLSWFSSSCTKTLGLLMLQEQFESSVFSTSVCFLDFSSLMHALPVSPSCS
ncbi:unnamed protein product [Boreogadus saida]